MDKTETYKANTGKDKQDANPVNPIDKEVARVEPSLETDSFSVSEQSDIVKMVIQDAKSDIEAMAEWLTDRQMDLKMYEGVKPSILENLVKKDWQSDRNLGMTSATCDAYQATLLATNWNLDTLNFKDSKENAIDRKDLLTEFSRWGLGRAESDVTQEVDDFIHNRITQGFSAFYRYWKVSYQWVDRRIPKVNNKGETIGYYIKTEKIRFERGVVENIANLEDFLTPTFGRNIQDLDHCIHILHLTGEDLLDFVERKIFININENFISKLRGAVFDWRLKSLGKEKAEQLGLKSSDDITMTDMRVYPIDIYCWYGMYTKNGRKERYRFHVEPTTNTFCAGKPLRKVPGCRTGKYPFNGGAFIRRPGYLRGKSLPRLIMHLMNALNNIYNQKSDFQYVENCPFGFHKPDENFDKQVFDLKPGVSYPSEDPKNVNFPNLTRSMAWAESDIKLLLELLERMTGAASYFMSNSQGVSGTATRDAIINEKSETRFGIWVRRLGDDISEMIDGWVEMYQDCAPPNLAERVVGEDGKKLFPNLSIETLQGDYTAYMAPDILSGSKTLKKQIFGIGYQMAQTSPWFNPQLNPRGNWKFTADTFKAMGLMNIEDYMPPIPPVEAGNDEAVSRVWQQLSQGETPDVDPNQNPMQLMQGLQVRIKEDLFKIDEEYRPNVKAYVIKLQVAIKQQLKEAQEQQIATAMASNIIHGINNGTAPGMAPQGNGALAPGTGEGKGQPPPAAGSGKVFGGLPDADIRQPSGIPALSSPNPGAPGMPPAYANQ